MKQKQVLRKQKQAQTADKYVLYQRSVQAPDVDARFFARVFKDERGRAPQVLREDFCGTAAVCCEWVKRRPERVAYGVDLDPECLDWGKNYNLTQLPPADRTRVHLVQGDVRTADTATPDIVAAQNFSYFIFETRADLGAYFRSAHQRLAPDGILILDLFGGYESLEDNREDVTDHGDFRYVWEQASFDPVSHHAVCKIHFRFPDKSEMTDAFVYEWRIWSIPEVRELVLEAGFSRADVYWEGTDKKTRQGTGIYNKRDRGECDPAWVCYVVGVK